MSGTWPMHMALAMVVGSAPAVGAQTDAAIVRGADSAAKGLGCASTGTTLRGWTGSGPALADEGAVSPARRAPLDTMVVLAVGNRTWSREHLDAGIALGAGGHAGTRGAPWSACAGAAAQLRSVSLLLRQVQGTIHLRVDPGALASVGTGTGTATPPVVPPRR